MAKYTVKAPDGKIITLEGPEGATQEEVIAQAQKLYSQQPKEPVGVLEQMFGAGSPTARVIKGAVVDPLLGVNQLLAETGLFGETVKQQSRGNIKAVEEAVQEGRKRVGSEGFDWLQLAGNVISPINKIAPTTQAATSLGRIGQTAASGALFGGLMPVTDGDNYLEDKLTQMGGGAAAGALLRSGIEVTGKLSKVVKELGQPLTDTGRKEILREYITKLGGPDKEKLITSLRQADELVTGSKPTVAEAVSDMPQATGLAAYQSRLATTMPEEGIAGKFAQREAEQQAARMSSLQTEVAQTPELLDLAKSLRSTDATRNYGQAFTQTITADPKLAKIVSNPYIRDVLPDAIKLAEAKGISAKTDLTQFLQYVKVGLDKQLTKTGDTALSRTEKEAVQQAKKQLIGWVSSKNPSFNLARESFAKASQPINQMEIGQYLQTKLGTPLGNKERAGAFVTAVIEAPQTIKKASGAAVGQTLDDVLTPKQVAVVDNIVADVSRKARAEELASKSTIGRLAQDTTELPNLLNRYATITNTVLKALKKDSNAEINRLAAELFLDPQKMAAFIEGVPKSKANVVVSALYKRLSPANRELLTKTLAVTREELDMLKQAATPEAPVTRAVQGIVGAVNQGQ